MLKCWTELDGLSRLNLVIGVESNISSFTFPIGCFISIVNFMHNSLEMQTTRYITMKKSNVYEVVNMEGEKRA